MIIWCRNFWIFDSFLQIFYCVKLYRRRLRHKIWADKFPRRRPVNLGNILFIFAKKDSKCISVCVSFSGIMRNNVNFMNMHCTISNLLLICHFILPILPISFPSATSKTATHELLPYTPLMLLNYLKFKWPLFSIPSPHTTFPPQILLLLLPVMLHPFLSQIYTLRKRFISSHFPILFPSAPFFVASFCGKPWKSVTPILFSLNIYLPRVLLRHYENYWSLMHIWHRTGEVYVRYAISCALTKNFDHYLQLNGNGFWMGVISAERFRKQLHVNGPISIVYE